MIRKEEYQGSETKGVVRGWCFVDLDNHFKTPVALGSMQIDDGELHLKPAHAVPLASARQHPENPKGKQGLPFAGARGGDQVRYKLPQIYLPSYLTAKGSHRIGTRFMFWRDFVLFWRFSFFLAPNAPETMPMPPMAPQKGGILVRFGSATSLAPPRPSFLVTKKKRLRPPQGQRIYLPTYPHVVSPSDRPPASW